MWEWQGERRREVGGTGMRMEGEVGGAEVRRQKCEERGKRWKGYRTTK